MYIEISGRQTHKTSRLVCAMESHLARHPKNVVCLTVFQMDMGKMIINKINPLYRNRINYTSTFSNHRIFLKGRFRDDYDDPRILYAWDEFDFMKRLDNIPVKKEGYYCTTPKFIRTLADWANWKDDPLLRLIVANDFMYTAHHGMKAFFNADDGAFQNAIISLGDERFKQEFMSGFDTTTNKPDTHNKPRARNDFAPGTLKAMSIYVGDLHV